MTNRQPAPRKPVLRNTCTAAAILSLGLVTGAVLGETSLMDLSMPRPSSTRLRSLGVAGGVNGYLMPADSPGQSRRPLSQPHGISGHHAGL